MKISLPPCLVSYAYLLTTYLPACLPVLQFYKAMKEVTSNPSQEVFDRWLVHPDIGPLMAVLQKSMMK